MALRGAINRGRGLGYHRETYGVAGSGQPRAQILEITKTKRLKRLNSIFFSLDQRLPYFELLVK